MKSIYTIIIALLISLTAFSQVYLPKNTDFFLYKKKNIVGKEPEINGLRIQLLITTNRVEANKLKYQFDNNYPYITSYLVYDKPEFKLRVGNYRNKWEAYKDLVILKKDYKSAFFVPDMIKFPPLKKI